MKGDECSPSTLNGDIECLLSSTKLKTDFGCVVRAVARTYRVRPNRSLSAKSTVLLEISGAKYNQGERESEANSGRRLFILTFMNSSVKPGRGGATLDKRRMKEREREREITMAETNNEG